MHSLTSLLGPILVLPSELRELIGHTRTREHGAGAWAALRMRRAQGRLSHALTQHSATEDEREAVTSTLGVEGIRPIR